MKNYQKAEKQIAALIEVISQIKPKEFDPEIELPVLLTMLRLLHVYIVGAEIDDQYAGNKLRK